MYKNKVNGTHKEENKLAEHVKQKLVWNRE